MSKVGDFLDEKFAFSVEDLMGATNDPSLTFLMTKRIGRAIGTKKAPNADQQYNGLLADVQAFDMSISAMQYLAQDDLDVFDVVVGVDCMGSIYAAALAYRFSKPFAIVSNMHNKSVGIYDNIPEGTKALMVSGAINNANKELIVIDSIKISGGSIWGVIALIDFKKEGGKQRLKDEGYDVKTVLTYTH